MRWWPAFILAAVCCATAAGACGDDETGGSGASGPESKCEKLCHRLGTIDCASDECVSDCEEELPKCDAEYHDAMECMADSTMLACVDDKPATDECSAKTDDLAQCILGGGAGGAGGGPSGTGGGEGGAGGGPSGTDCEKACAKADSAGCAPANCVSQCGTPLPKCDAEFSAFMTCAGTRGTVTCNAGKPKWSGCEAQETAFLDCLLGGGDSCYENHGDCDPLDATSCPANQGCYLTNADSFACFPKGAVPVGGGCVGAEDCGANLVCAGDAEGNTCLAWCCSDNDCGTGSCTEYGAAGSIDVKLCLP